LILKPKPMIHRIAITKARINLGQVARRVHLHKEYFILEKDGIPVAALMNVDELEDYLDLHNPKLKQQVEQGYHEYRGGKTRAARSFLKELSAEFKPAKRKGARA